MTNGYTNGHAESSREFAEITENIRTDSVQEGASFAQGIACGHVTAWLESFAERSDIPFEILAERVGRQLLAASGRESVGIEHRVSTRRVPRKTTTRSATVESVEMAGRTHGDSAQVGRYRGGERNRDLRKLVTLPQQRDVECMECGAKVGAFCTSLGTRKSAKGTEMRTSCHTARVEAAVNHFAGKPKPNARKSVWTPERRREMSLKMRRLNFSKHGNQ